MPRWDEIAGNYAARTRDRLNDMVGAFRPGNGGRLLLWTGAPGTGKTYALRALAWEWRDWCSVHYVTDPDSMFGSESQYLMQMVMRPESGDRWRLLVLEDTGELLTADAKSRTGQGLSRLLNVVDGLIGQGFPTLVLVSTNEDLKTLHPAIARPGRCAVQLEFELLSESESTAWMAARGLTHWLSGRHTLAELYALAEGYDTAARPRSSVGFAP